MNDIINSNRSMNLNDKNLAGATAFLNVFLWLALMLVPLVQVLILTHTDTKWFFFTLYSLNFSCSEDYRATED